MALVRSRAAGPFTMYSQPFVAFSPSHLAVLAFVIVVAAGMTAIARTGCCPRASRCLEYALVALMLVAWPLDVWAATFGPKGITLEHVMPLHLCDLASFAAVGALLWRKPLAAELTWFWAMAGTLNGLLTPALEYDVPNPAFFSFFALHAGVIISAIYVVAGLGLWPRPGAVWRVFGLSVAYLLAVTLVNSVLQTNFAFVCTKPESASLLDALGPHPWYVVALLPIALTAFSILYLPFWTLRKLSRKQA